MRMLGGRLWLKQCRNKQLLLWLSQLSVIIAGVFSCSTVILFLDECWGVWQIELLSLGTQCEEAQAERASAIWASTATLAFLVCKGIQAIVNRDLIASLYLFPSKYTCAFAHRIRIAGVIEIATWWKQNRTGLPIEFAEMALFLVCERWNIVIVDDTAIAAAKEKSAG